MLRHYISAICLALTLSGCTLGRNEPYLSPVTKSHAQDTIETLSKVVDTLCVVDTIEDIFFPDEPYELYYGTNGLYKIKAYIGYDWYSKTGRCSFWPRTDGDLTKRGSLIIFPQYGGEVLFEIVNNHTDFSLYITNYNKKVASEVYYFDESGGYPGVLSFSEYGEYYYSITYRLIVKPNNSDRVINFCQAHWASNKDRCYLSDFQIQCRIMCEDGEINSITILDIN